MPNKTGTITLTAAAAQARMRYNRMLNHVLCGDVHGWQKEGRWVVEATDLARFIAERANALPSAA